MRNQNGFYSDYVREAQGWREGEGERERLCTGSGHDEPTWLPETEKYFYQHKSGTQAGKFQSRCRLCFNWNRLKSPGVAGYVPRSSAYPFVYEAIARVGLSEVSRRAQVSRSTLTKFMSGEHVVMRKRTLKRIMLELISMRRKGEVRHKDSIRTGAYLRGQEEKTPRHRRDFHGWHNDAEAERGRARRVNANQAGS